jgi:hypothetical protein
MSEAHDRNELGSCVFHRGMVIAKHRYWWLNITNYIYLYKDNSLQFIYDNSLDIQIGKSNTN